jgi:hypothetical protein
MNEMISPLTEGLFWSWIVPAALFVIAFGATWLLYRSFRERD